MKTRLALSRAVLHRPDLLLLDEPTSGLDPESALAVLDLIRTMTSEGQTVLMCTHLLLEAEGLADEIIVLDGGTNLVAGRPEELASLYWPTPEVQISSRRPEDLDQLAAAPGVVGYERSGDTARLQLDRVDRTPAIVSALVGLHVPIDSVVPFAPSLEDLYFAVRRDAGSVVGDIAPPETSTGRPARELPRAA